MPQEPLWRRLRRWPGRRLRRKTVRVRLDELVPRYATDERVLDLGCADSRYAQYFPRRTGLDVVPGRGVQVVADAHSLPFRWDVFSFVLCTEMLEHARDPQRAIDEMRRVLVPGGKVLLTTRFLFPIHEAPKDFFRFTKYGLRHLFRRWTAVEIRADTLPFETLGELLRRIAFQSDLRWGRASVLTLLVAARLLPLGDRLIRKEYGDYARSVGDERVLTSGYHVLATKPDRPDGA